jgi:hypothetical protein
LRGRRFVNLFPVPASLLKLVEAAVDDERDVALFQAWRHTSMLCFRRASRGQRRQSGSLSRPGALPQSTRDDDPGAGALEGIGDVESDEKLVLNNQYKTSSEKSA